MKVKMLMVLVASLLAVGCATNSDIEGLQTQISGIKISVVQITTDVQNAKAASAEALTKATAAEDAATRAALLAADTNIKLDTVFKNAMLK